MVFINIKMRDGVNYNTQLDMSLEDAEKYVFGGAQFVKLAYENGWAYLNIGDIQSAVAASQESQDFGTQPQADDE